MSFLSGTTFLNLNASKGVKTTAMAQRNPALDWVVPMIPKVQVM